MIAGIVGSEAAKFTPETEILARAVIRQILTQTHITGLSSGHCHLGGVDIWAEEEADALGIPKERQFIFPPHNLFWATGYKPRNIQIATASAEMHCITIKELPPDYKGMRFLYCYHCKTKDHIKSGGCWTAHYAQKLGKPAIWHVV